MQVQWVMLPKYGNMRALYHKATGKMNGAAYEHHTLFVLRDWATPEFMETWPTDPETGHSPDAAWCSAEDVDAFGPLVFGETAELETKTSTQDMWWNEYDRARFITPMAYAYRETLLLDGQVLYDVERFKQITQRKEW